MLDAILLIAGGCVAGFCIAQLINLLRTKKTPFFLNLSSRPWVG
jgi:hypothetical protein